MTKHDSIRLADGAALSRRQFLGTGAALTAGAATLAAAQLAMAAEVTWEQASDKKIRMGIVGGGFGCSFHWHEHPNCTVQAVSDLIPERRNALMEKYQCAKSYESLELLVLDPDIDAVAIFTGAPDHPKHTVLCMEHGKHCISAVPACMTLEQAAQLKEIKERTGLKYMNAETSYYRWETITARRLMQDNALGELVYTEAEYYHPSNEQERNHLWYRDGERTWRYAYPPMLYPTHSTAFLVGVTRERLTKVSCIGWGDPERYPALKENAYTNPFMNGMAMFLTDKKHPFRCNVAWDIQASGERAQWFGTKGALYSPGSGGQPLAMIVEGQRTDALPDYWHMLPPKMRYDSGHGASHPFITNEFIMALVEGREPAIDLYEALAFCVPGIVAHQSSFKDGEQLTIPSFDPA
jgi:predicted dehydrogenase